MILSMKLSIFNFIKAQREAGLDPVDVAIENNFSEKIVKQIYNHPNLFPEYILPEDDIPTPIKELSPAETLPNDKIKYYDNEMIYEELDAGMSVESILAAYDFDHPEDEGGKPKEFPLTIEKYVRIFKNRKASLIIKEQLFLSRKCISLEQLKGVIQQEDWQDILPEIAGRQITFPAQYKTYMQIKYLLSINTSLINISKGVDLSYMQIFRIKKIVTCPPSEQKNYIFWQRVNRIQKDFGTYAEKLMLQFEGCRLLYVPGMLKTLRVWGDWGTLPWKEGSEDYIKNYKHKKMQRASLRRHREIIDMHVRQGLTPEQIYLQIKQDAYSNGAAQDIKLKNHRRKLSFYTMTTINRILLLYKRLNEIKYLPVKHIPGKGKHIHQKLGTRHYNSITIEDKS